MPPASSLGDSEIRGSFLVSRTGSPRRMESSGGTGMGPESDGTLFATERPGGYLDNGRGSLAPATQIDKITCLPWGCPHLLVKCFS